MSCHFCSDTDGEMGEFWSSVLNRAVVAHPECLPCGVDAAFDRTDPEWSFA